MRKPINYIQGRAVEGKWKEELIIECAKLNGLKTFIESGSCEGATLAAVCMDFDKCYSIELSDYYYQYCEEKFKPVKNVILIKGDSGKEIRKILELTLFSPTLFFLDAHHSNEHTANTDPLTEEIKAIVELRPNALILVDDEPNAELTRCGINFEGWTREYHYGIVFLYKTGLYTIPNFE